MAILEGAVGGLLAALITLLVTERLRTSAERETAVVGIGSELAHNLSVAADVLAWNVKVLRDSSDSRTWWELVSFSDVCWAAISSGGLLSRLKPTVIESTARSYAELKKADYSAGKLQHGKVYWRKAAEYTIRVFDAGEAMSAALLTMKKEPRYEKILANLGQLEGALSRWKQNVSTWEAEVDRVRAGFRSSEN